MDAELLELQKQFESAQQAKSSVRLSDRNVVELVHKLQELRFLDFDLLHTVTGKEYITPEQLKKEIGAEIKKRGRVSLIDLSDAIGVDLYHVEKQAHQIVAEDAGLMIVNGEVVADTYWDAAAEEIEERLQECSQIALAEIAAQLQVGSEMVVAILEPRIGTIIKGRLEGGQLYTPAYVSRICAMVRGAARGITVPTNLVTVWNSLQQLLQDMDGANGVSVEGAFFQSQFNGLVKEGEILGSLRAGVQWTPAVFAHAQRESVESFFSQNSYIGYDVLHKLAIPQPKQYLQSRYPEGIPLEGVFVHPSMVDMLDSAIEDAVGHGNWIDSRSVLPAYVSGEDVSKILSLCPSVQKAFKSSKAILLGNRAYLATAISGQLNQYSDSMTKNTVKQLSVCHESDLFERIEKDMDTLGFTSLPGQGLYAGSHSANEPKGGRSSGSYSELKEIDDDGSSKNVSEKGSKKKKGKGSAKAGAPENDSGNQENLPSKSKKNQWKTKDTSSLSASDSKSGTRKGSEKVKGENLNVPSEEWIMQKILTAAPDLGEFGDPEDPDSLLRHLSSHLKPMLVDSWTKRRNTVLLENSVRRRRLLDNLQKQLDEAFLDLQLYEKALDLFEDEPSTSVILHKHLLKTIATSIADKFIATLVMDNKLSNGIEVGESESPDSASVTCGDRIALVKSLPGSLSTKAQAVVEALEGKRVETFTTALKAIAEECGLLLKKLDKKLERTLLHSYRKDLTAQIYAENDPVALLPKVVALLYLQVYNKALQAPGRAISAAVSRLKDKLPDSTYKILMDYHSATVTLLALQAAATEDEEDCTADRILSKKELLESKMPELKGLVLNISSSSNS